MLLPLQLLMYQINCMCVHTCFVCACMCFVYVCACVLHIHIYLTIGVRHPPEKDVYLWWFLYMYFCLNLSIQKSYVYFSIVFICIATTSK